MNWLTLLFESDGSRGEDVVVLLVVETVIKKSPRNSLAKARRREG